MVMEFSFSYNNNDAYLKNLKQKIYSKKTQMV